MLNNNYTTKSTHIDNHRYSYRYILSELSYLLCLDCLEPLNFAILKVKLRKALKLTLTEFYSVYTVMTKKLVQMAQTCVTAAHLIDIDEKELELFQSDRCKYGDLTADEFDSLQRLYEQAIEALNDEQASLCGEIEQ